MHAQMGTKQKAIPFLKKSAKLLEALPVSTKIPALFEAISATFSNLGDYVAALKYQKAYANSQQVLFDQDKATAMLELTTRYESESEAEEHKQQIASLEKDQAMNLR